MTPRATMRFWAMMYRRAISPGCHWSWNARQDMGVLALKMAIRCRNKPEIL